MDLYMKNNSYVFINVCVVRFLYPLNIYIYAIQKQKEADNWNFSAIAHSALHPQKLFFYDKSRGLYSWAFYFLFF